MTIEQSIFEAGYNQLRKKYTIEQSQLLANLMVAQSKFESNNYTSNVYKKNNNAFGYTYYSGSAYQLGKGTSNTAENLSYGRYVKVSDSAREVGDWICRRHSSFVNVKTVAEYAHVMKVNAYYTGNESNYAAGMKLYYNEKALLKPSLLNRIMPFAIAGGVVLALFVIK